MLKAPPPPVWSAREEPGSPFGPGVRCCRVVLVSSVMEMLSAPLYNRVWCQLDKPLITGFVIFSSK